MNYARARRRMRYEAEKGKKIQQRRLDRDTRIYALKEALSGNSSLECLLVGEKTWIELTEFQQKRLFRQATAVATFLELCQKFKENRKQVYINDIRQMACNQCPFDLYSNTLRIWHKQFIHNGDKFSECLTGKWEREWLLEQTDLKQKACEFLNRFHDWKQVKDDEYLSTSMFQNFLNDELLQGLTVEELKGVTWPVSRETARVWMHRLGFGFGTYMKDVYFDGHDRADVVEYKVGFLKRMDAYQKRSHLFFRSSVHDARFKYVFSEVFRHLFSPKKIVMLLKFQ